MARLHLSLLVSIPIVSILAALARPKLSLLGIFRAPSQPLALDQCVEVPGFEACEDAWIDHDKGLAYLACSTQEMRANWAPALGTLNTAALPRRFPDSLHLYNFDSGASVRIELDGLPQDSQGVWVHGVEGFLYPDGETVSLFVVSHRPRVDRARSEAEGADSVVEIFEGARGGHRLEWVKTVRHDEVKTPNNVVATGARSFYVSNDHARKVHWTRNFEMIHAEPSTIVHCDASRDEPDCVVAVDGVTYPNGIARLPNTSTLYAASTMTGEISMFEIQSDHTLFPLPGTISLDRPIDNIHLSPSSGALYAATFPKMLGFMRAAKTGGRDAEAMKRNPVEIWKIEEEKGEGRFYGHQHKTSLALSDPENEVVSSITTAAPYKNKLLLTGYFTKQAVVCTMSDTL
ncbi:hypothetical protein JCM10212_005733 [Sporobolomyces blumeae]